MITAYFAFSIPNPLRWLFGLGTVLQHSRTPLLRVAGCEDEDENEAPCEVSPIIMVHKLLPSRPMLLKAIALAAIAEVLTLDH